MRKIQHKRGLESRLPQLDMSELGFTTDTDRVFFGGASGNVELAKKINTTTSIIPDKFKGTDLQKVQAAINAALVSRLGVEFDRLYNITGGTITINKSLGDRVPLRLFSNSHGGIIKNDAGIIFKGAVDNTGDVFIDGLTYQSVSGAGTIVFSCPSLIRVQSSLCAYVNVDCVVKGDSANGYLQSMRFKNENITGGKGAAFEFGGAYDCSWTDLLIEHREHGFLHLPVGTNPEIYNSRIRDCCLEGLSGKAIQLKECNNVLIDGCYFEFNTGGHIFFDSTSSKGVTVSNCRHHGADSTALIVWKGYIQATSFSNVSTNIPVHDIRQMNNNSVIYSTNDLSFFGESWYTSTVLGDPVSKNFFRLQLQDINETNGMQKFFGPVRKSTMVVTNIDLLAGELKEVQVRFPDPVREDDILSCQLFRTNQANVVVCYLFKSTVDDNTVSVVLKNIEAIDIGFNKMTVTRMNLVTNYLG